MRLRGAAFRAWWDKPIFAPELEERITLYVILPGLFIGLLARCVLIGIVIGQEAR